MTGGEMSVSVATLSGKGKAAWTRIVSGSGTSVAGAAPAGEVTAEAAAGAGVAAEARAETRSTEEAEVRKFPLSQ